MENVPTLLYHEQQVASLCGMHCLNALLQGPYFTEFDLGAMAEALDNKEREMMMESGTDSADFLKYMAEDSGNVAADGNFSIQVLSQALDVWNLQCIPLNSPEGVEAALNPDLENSFICHLEAHWFTLRKVDGEWYNFNSLYAAPEHLSQFYLSAYFATLRSGGWTIFTIRGELPRSMGGTHQELPGGYGLWMTPVEAKKLIAAKKEEGSRNKGVGNDELSQALAASMTGSRGGDWSDPGTSGRDDEDEFRAAIAASLAGPGPSSRTLQKEGGYDWATAGSGRKSGIMKASKVHPVEVVCPDLGHVDTVQSLVANEVSPSVVSSSSANELGATLVEPVGDRTAMHAKQVEDSMPSTRLTSGNAVAAAELSAERPSAGRDAESIELAVRTPEGQRIRALFAPSTTVKAVLQHLEEQGVQLRGRGLCEAFPGSKAIQDDSLTLAEAGISNMSTLILKPK